MLACESDTDNVKSIVEAYNGRSVCVVRKHTSPYFSRYAQHAEPKPHVGKTTTRQELTLESVFVYHIEVTGHDL